jgi:hypothetical protein
VPAGVAAPFSGCDAPNAVWCIDFKGWFETLDGVRCYPLTLLDGFGRFLLRCEALVGLDGRQVRRILDSAFLQFGLPLAIRSDGGPPFALDGARATDRALRGLLQLGLRVVVQVTLDPFNEGDPPEPPLSVRSFDSVDRARVSKANERAAARDARLAAAEEVREERERRRMARPITGPTHWWLCEAEACDRRCLVEAGRERRRARAAWLDNRD